MPLAAQRRHVIASLHHPFPAIVLYQHLLCPSVVLLVLRTFVQTRIATPRKSHPEATLRILAVFVLGMNMFATFIHVLDLAEGTMPGKSLLIDFIGLRSAPAPALILGLDAFITFYQLITLYIGYLSYPVPTAISKGFPADPLLPPDHGWRTDDFSQATVKDVIFENEDDEESQLASVGHDMPQGNDQERTPRRAPASSSRPSRNGDPGEDEDEIYSKADDLLQRTDPDGDVLGDTYHHLRPRHPDEPYTVVNIPLGYMLKTIFTYPRPSSISTLETSASTTTAATTLTPSTSANTEGVTSRQGPTTLPSTFTDLQIQALAGLHPGLLNAAARDRAPTEASERDDGRADYRRMPGSYTRPST